MNRGFCHALYVSAVVALLPSCTGPLSSSGSPAPIPQAVTRAAHSSRNTSSALLYVTGCDGVCIYSLSDWTLVGTIKVAAYSLCSDQDGNAFVTSSVNYGKGVIYEYPFGTTEPSLTLNMGSESVFGCAVDPLTGNLAVAAYGPPYYGVAIFKKPYATPTYYSYGRELDYASYDNAGNLYVDSNRSGPVFAELPNGSSTFVTIKINKKLRSYGQVQWDGSYITLQTLQHNLAIYRIQVSGSKGTVVGTTPLKEGKKKALGPSWILGSQVFAGCEDRTAKRPRSVCVWSYPAGGAGHLVLKHIAHGIEALTVSKAPSS